MNEPFPTRVHIRMFGAIALEDGTRVLGPRDLGSVKTRQLFEALLVARGHPVSKQRLAQLLWGDDLPQNVRGALEQYVCVVRGKLSGGEGRAERLVATQSGAYRFRVEEADVDLDRFDDLVERAELETGPARRRTLEDALALVRGDVLEDERHAPWAEALRETYRRRVDDLRVDAAEAALAARDLRAALAHAEAGMLADPYNERPYRIAMLAHYGLGRQHDALEAFGRCRALLGSELGVEPMPDTKSLHHAILQQVDREFLLPPRESDEAIETGPAEAATARPALPVVTLIERAADGDLRHQVEPLARTLGARIGAARCAPGRRNAVEAIAEALVDAVGENGFRDALSTPKSLVEAIRSHAPLVLVVEDIHRAEPTSVAVLDQLQRECADVPVVMLASYRPGRVPVGHPLAAPGAAGSSVLRGDAARTWLLRIAAPLLGALQTLSLWCDELLPVLPDALA